MLDMLDHGKSEEAQQLVEASGPSGSSFRRHASYFNTGFVTFVGMWSNVFIMVRSWLMKRGVEPASPHALSRRDMLYSLTHFSAFRKALIRSYFSI